MNGAEKHSQHTANLSNHRRYCRREGKKTNNKRTRAEADGPINKRCKEGTREARKRARTNQEEGEEERIRGERPGPSTDFENKRQKQGETRAKEIGIKRIRPEELTDAQLEKLKKIARKDYHRCDNCKGVYINAQKLEEHKKVRKLTTA